MRRLLLYAGGLILCAPAFAGAHGIGQRIDLPIPLDLYLVGGACVVALSFLGLWFLPPRYLSRFENSDGIPVPFLNWVVLPVTIRIASYLTLAFFLLVLSAGLFGISSSEENILPTAVWIIFALGMTFVSAFVGDVWKHINPIKTIYNFLKPLLPAYTRVSEVAPSPSRYLWFAVGGFLFFRWVENIFPFGAEPRILAGLILFYLLYSLIGMILYGRRTWCTYADPFCVFFTYLSRFSFLHVVQNQVFLRIPATGLLRNAPSLSGTFFVLLMIAGVTADGFFDTPIMKSVGDWSHTLGVSDVVTYTFALLMLYGVFLGIYFGLSRIVALVLPGVMTTTTFARSFVFSLIPISVGYEVAHYLSLLTLEGQRFIALMSDPFGFGWDIFGTAEWAINYSSVNLKILWNIQVGAIIIGHVLAVLIAHTVAERVFTNRDHVLASQYPMLIIMLFYTMFSLWIIAQPVVV